MSELEDLIRDSMRSREGGAPEPGTLLTGIAARERTRRRRLQSVTVLGTVAAVVAVLLVAGPLGHLAGGGSTAASAGPGGTSATPASGPPGTAGPVDSNGFVAALVRTPWTLEALHSATGDWQPDSRVQASLTLTDHTFTAADICERAGGAVTYDAADQRLTFLIDGNGACLVASPAPGTETLRPPPGYLAFFTGTVSASVSPSALTLRSAAGTVLRFRPAASATPSTTASPASTAASPGDGDPTLCGAWSAATAPFGLGVAHDYGAIESCFPYGTSPTSWVITTDGVNGGPGYVGVDRCTTADCASGVTDHTQDRWVYHRANGPGSVRLWAAPVAGQVLQLTVGGRQETFDLATGTFSSSSNIGPAGIPGLPVTGTLQMAGGPAPGAVINVPGTVVFLSINSGFVVTAKAAKDGRFSAAVPPGAYTVTGSSPNYGGGAGSCGGDRVTIPADIAAVPVVHVYCQMK